MPIPFSLDTPQARAVVTPIAIADLPVDGPATLLATSPPSAVEIRGSFDVVATASVGAAAVTPYCWDGSVWAPLGDAVDAPKLLSVNAATVSTGRARFISQTNVSFVWAFVKTGGGTISYCSTQGGVY